MIRISSNTLLRPKLILLAHNNFTKLIELLSLEWLSKEVPDHAIGGTVFNFDFSRLYTILYKVEPNINVAVRRELDADPFFSRSMAL
jgi:hypothetical protein